MSTPQVSPPAYLLGTDDIELQRLSRQHALWLRDTAAHWSRAGFATGHTILDIGCGPGFATRDLACLLGPTGRVIALDESPRYIDFIERWPRSPGAAPIEVIVGDARQIALPDRSLHGAYARWVFTFIDDPDAVVARVARALRPGGVFAVLDYLNWPALLWGPRNETLPAVRKAVMATYEQRGAEHSIGYRMPSVLARNGLLVRELSPLMHIARPGTPLWDWPEDYFRSFLPRTVEAGHLSPEVFAAWEAEWTANAADPAGFFVTPPQIEIIAVKPG